VGFLVIAHVAAAQVESAQPTRQLITQAIDENKLVTLAGNTRSEANATNDRGAVAADLPMEHMQLQLQLPVEKEHQLEQFAQELQDPTSAYFHQWLTTEQFRQDFSLAPEDVEIITSWLQSKGFSVNVIYPRSIDFSGTAAQVEASFRTEIHNLDVNGVAHFANMSDPQIPAALAPAIVGVMSLNDFKPRPANLQRVNYTAGSGDYLVVPADLATIYDFNPIFSKGVSGQGQTIVVIEDTDLYTTADWTTFRSILGLSGYTAGSFSTVHPAPPSGTNNCSDPGVNGDDGEAILDAEWSSAAAPSANIVLASCTGIGETTITSFGGFIALQNLLNESAPPPAIVSISYGESESEIGATTNAAISALYQQAVTEGVSVFVSSGDEGAASSDADLSKATHGITVSGYTSTPYNVSVGGTDFGDTYTKTNSTYWGSTNSSTYGSALSYIPEIPWNDSCAGQLLAAYADYAATYGSNGFCNSTTGEEFLTTAAGSGGPSGCATGKASTAGVVSGTCAGYAKPSWQSVLGNPSDGVRDIPDVSLFAANGVWGHYYVACFSDTSNGGKSCAGAPSTWAGYGGTSISSPIMAAIQALANQTVGSSAGDPDTTYYSLAQTEYGAGGNSSCNSSLGNTAASSCIFYDVTAGDMDVNCTGTHNCYLDSATHGVLSLSDTAYQLAYGTNTGWDFATGIGTVNANNFVSNWPKPSNPAALSITSSHSGNFAQGEQDATYTVSVSNGASANPTSGTVTVTDALPSGLTLVSMTGSGWTCATITCTRSNTLNAGLSYPAITVTVSVASDASSPQVNQVNVSGGDSPTANASDSTLIIGPPVLGITSMHSGNFTQGQQNATYAVTVSNGASAGPTSGTVTVTETLPSGLTLVSMAGTGWTCTTNTCSTSNVLAAGSSYPAITVTVNVTSNASSPQVNQVSVAGGGSAPANASDSTTIQTSSSWSNGYTNMRTIVINSGQVPHTDQTNFPVLISLPANTYTDLKTTANGGVVTNANGYDILFTSDAAGTQPLAYERESYSGSTGAMIDWVNVPTVSHSANTSIYLFYGNAAVSTDQSNPSGTWDSSYVGVWHLPNGTTLSANDSTSNANNGTINGATAASGEVDGAASFNGSSNYLDLGNANSLKLTTGNSLTLEAWIKPASEGTYQFAIDKSKGGTAGYTLAASYPGGGPYLAIDSGYITTNSAIATGVWNHLVGVATWNGSSYSLAIYLNGVNQTNGISGGTDTLTDPGTDVALGRRNSDSSTYLDGSLDEVRISKTARSADWIATEYNNQSNPSNFYAVGAAVTGGGGASIPAIANLSPPSAVAGAAAQTLTINGSGFLSTSTVTFNGVGHAATFVNSTQLTILLSAPDQATAGSYPVVVTDPGPSGGISSPVNFTVLPLAAPPGLAATAGNTQVSLTWNASTGASSYNIYSSTTTGGPYTEITSVTTLSYTNMGLTNGTPYYYVVTAVNSSGETGYSNQASATPTANSSFSNGYTNMRTIVINSGQVPHTDQTNFPVLISLPANTYTDLKTTANGGVVTNANGYDILFTSDAAGTQPLAYERESYSGSTGAMIDWVNVPTVSHSANTSIYLFYGNAAVSTDQSNPSGTWDSSYVGVWHLPNGTTLSANDSTSNANNGTINGATAASGEVDGAASFNGSSNYLDLGNANSLKLTTGNSLTLEAWIKPASEGTYQFAIDKSKGGTAGYTLAASYPGGGPYLAIDSGYITTNSAIATGVWNHLVGVATWNGSSYSLAIYLNGVNQTNGISGGTDTLTDPGTDVALGRRNSDSSTYLDGSLDEVRISKTARSADWIATEYNNQSNPSNFYAVGAAVTGGGGASIPAIANLSPTSSALGASVTTTGLNFRSSQETSTVQLNRGFASSVR
jgi:uncharacterized repeat protein (TIGR01451 family)